MSIGNENSKPLKDSKLRHIEYYNLQSQFDELYKRSRNNEIFDNLMDIIISPENVLLAYRNIKNNSGSNTPGTDKLSIQDIAKLTQEEMIQMLFPESRLKIAFGIMSIPVIPIMWMCI